MSNRYRVNRIVGGRHAERACYFFVLLFVGAIAIAIESNADEPSAAQAAKDRAVVETLLRLKGVDVNSSPNWKAAAIRHLETLKGTPRYVELVEQLRLRGVEDELFRLAMADPSSTTGAKATALLVKEGERSRFERVAKGADEPLAWKAIVAMGTVGDAATVEVLRPLITAADRSASVRVAAATAMGANRAGQQYLLELARTGKLPTDLKFTVANVLLTAADESTRLEAGKYLSLPVTADARPLPPVAELVRAAGDAVKGKRVFDTIGTCAKCHKLRGEGKDVGPDLSEIGGKLSRDALFVSILDPSAGISHNYETHVLVTTGGNVLTGLLVSRTDQSVTIRTAEAIDREIAANEIDELRKTNTSLMPADLQKLLSIQDLVDVVEFLGALTKQ